MTCCFFPQTRISTGHNYGLTCEGGGWIWEVFELGFEEGVEEVGGAGLISGRSVVDWKILTG